MNYELKGLPERMAKPRAKGITMVMDKGLSVREAEDFVEVNGQFTDLIKLGFGTSIITPNLKAKLKVYQNAGIPYYFGGTLFEAFVARGQFENYIHLIEEFELVYVEVSDGCLEIEHQQKCAYISQLAENAIVLSEIGSKDETKIMAPYIWIELIEKELAAGSWKVIAEARESGNIGVCRASGEVRMGLVNEILHAIKDQDSMIWEAPKKQQQAWFIDLQGANVNLGNIATNDVIPLETLRLGLRADTFFKFLDKA